MNRNAFLALALACATAAALSCGDSTAPVPVVASISISATKDTLAALGDTSHLSAVAKDAAGNAIPGRPVTWSSSVSAVATVDAASGIAIAVGNGQTTIMATVDGIMAVAPLTVSQVVTGVAVTPGTHALTSIGATQQYTAAATDANGSAVAGARLLWISSNPAVATVDTTGLATARGPGQTSITAAAQGVPGHAALSVTQAATQLAFRVGPPATTVAGEAFATAVQVEIRDAAGSVVRDAQLPVTLAGAGATLKGTTTVNAIGGVASFSGLFLETAGNGYTMSAAATGLSGAQSGAFAVTHAAATRLAYTDPPVMDSAGANLGVTVAVQDRFGNTVTSATDTVRLGLYVNPASGTLSGDTVVAAVGGIATFAGPRILKSGAGYRLRAATAGLDSAHATFDITAASPHHIEGPTSGYTIAGVGFGPGPDLTIRDQFDNVVIAGTHDVTFAIDSVPYSPFQTIGALTRSTVNGAVSFEGLIIDRPANEYGRYSGLFTAPGMPALRLSFAAVLGTPLDLAAGGNHTCARITSAGAPRRTFCWGANAAGQLGSQLITAALDSAPVPSAAGYEAMGLASGEQHTCILWGASPVCWGANDQGQLGSAGAGGRTPAVVSGNHSLRQVVAGGFHTCGLSAADSTALCWGDNSAGQLGDGGAPADQSAPVAVSGGRKFSRIAAGRYHTCAIQLSDSTAYCWGQGSSGQLGKSDTTSASVPTAVTASPKFVALALGEQHSCGITAGASQKVYCWGDNSVGQAGTNDAPADKLVPTEVLGFTPDVLNPHLTFTAGAFHTCAKAFGSTTGHLYCWGSTSEGQLGPNVVGTSAPAPVIAVNLLTQGLIDRVSAGRYHTCVLVSGYAAGATLTSGMYCWGRGTEGQLGAGTTSGGATFRRVEQ